MPDRKIADPDVAILAGLSRTLRPAYKDKDLNWVGSPFSWVKARPSSSQRGKIGAQLVEGWCEAKGLNVAGPVNRGHDRIIEGMRTEIKFSTAWDNGGYKFQQFRDQDYDIAICLGVSPFDAHCWTFTKQELFTWIRLKLIKQQHGGERGTDTWWFTVQPPDNVPSWLVGHGGRLSEAFAALKKLAGAQ